MLTDASFVWAMLSTTHSFSGLVGVRLVRLTWLAERAAKCLHLPAREDLEKILPAQAGSPTTSPFITVEELRELPTGLNGQLPLLVVQASPISASGTAYAALPPGLRAQNHDCMQALTSFLGGLTELRFIHEDWSDEEVIAAASLLRFCPCVKQLTIGIEGLTKRGYGALGELFGASKHSSASLRLLSTDCISTLDIAGALPALEYLSVGQYVIGRDMVPLVEGLYPGISAANSNEMGFAGDVALPALK
ncbi:MAG: hypothetical protein SGPRY_008671, partial [Prymnesium sp.]